jgi:hypothetical protein
VRHAQNECLGPFERGGEVTLNADIHQTILIAEEPCP